MGESKNEIKIKIWMNDKRMFIYLSLDNDEVYEAEL